MFSPIFLIGLADVVTAINRALSTAYGSAVQILPAEVEIYLPDGMRIPTPTD